MNSKKNSILILGNGFDLDLGLPTSYKDFANSPFWPFNEPLDKFDALSGNLPESIHDLMHYDSKSKTWFDIEASLGRYATLNYSYNPLSDISNHEEDFQRANVDQAHYNKLVESLSQYLISIQENSINENSTAAKVLKAICESSWFSGIFSFNYTNLKIFSNKLGITSDFWYTHMHGNLSNGIILGIENYMDFFPGYRYMCKEYNPNYASRFLTHRLQQAHEVVFFGHSLSEIDYHYFKQFFAKQSDPNLSQDEAKVIVIFTYDNESRMNILDRLRIMNDKHLDHLFGKNFLHIICTDGSEQNRVKEFFEHLKKLDNPNVVFDKPHW